MHCPAQPEFAAIFRKRSLEKLEFPSLNTLVAIDALKQSLGSDALFIKDRSPVFWKGDHYDLNLDELQIEEQKAGWRMLYKGTEIGSSKIPGIWFDDRIEVHQQNWPPPLSDSGKPRTPLYIFADNTITLHSNLNPLESAAVIHPLALITSNSITVAGDVPAACKLNAMLVGLGQEPSVINSLAIDAGSKALTQAEKDRFATEVASSSFLVEDEKRSRLLTDLYANQKIVWFRGSVILAGRLDAPSAVKQLHLEASRDTFPLFASFPFVYQVEGSKQWQ